MLPSQGFKKVSDLLTTFDKSLDDLPESTKEDFQLVFNEFVDSFQQAFDRGMIVILTLKSKERVRVIKLYNLNGLGWFCPYFDDVKWKAIDASEIETVSELHPHQIEILEKLKSQPKAVLSLTNI